MSSREAGKSSLSQFVESVIESPELVEAFKDLKLSPIEKGEELKGIIERGVEDFTRFYIRLHKPEEKFLTAKQVAARYGLKEQWVYHCEELQAIAFKVGKFLRYRESDVEKFEKSRIEKQKAGPPKGYSMETLIRRGTQTNNEDDKAARFVCK